jgi:hypothetical protein
MVTMVAGGGVAEELKPGSTIPWQAEMLMIKSNISDAGRTAL